MKKYLVLLIIVTIIVSCKDQSKKQNANIVGTIENPIMNTIIIRGHNFNQTINIKEDGSFIETLPIESNGYYSLIHGRESLLIYLNSGDNLKVFINANEFATNIKFEGKGANENNYLVAKSNFLKNNTVDFPMLFSMEQSDFLQTINKLEAKVDTFLDDTVELNEDFIDFEKKNNHFDNLVKLQLYPSYHIYFTKNDNLQLSNEFNLPFKDFDFGNENHYNNFDSYKRLVLNHYSETLNSDGNTSTIFEELKTLNSEIIKEDIAKMFSNNISLGNENNKIVYDGIMTISNDVAFKEKLTTKYNKVKHLAKGMQSPVFTNYENHKGGETSLGDLKGKYVYIDVWATWCAPCIKEIPFLKDLEKEYEGRNISFVSTSIDEYKDRDIWFKMINDKKLKGIQLLADSDWQSQFIKEYDIIGIPRFILIDPSGNIVSADAPRPSDPKLINIFKELKL